MDAEPRNPARRFLSPNIAYEKAIQKFNNKAKNLETETEYKFPGLRYTKLDKNFDVEDNQILINPEDVVNKDFADMRDYFFERLSDIYEVRVNSEALTRRSKKDVQWLEKIYEVNLKFSGAFFRNLEGNALAKSRRKSGEFIIDLEYMDSFDPVKEKFDEDDPVRNEEDQVERLNRLIDEGRSELDQTISKVASTPLHELRHFTSYSKEKANLEWKKNRPDISSLAGEDKSWGKDITVACLEAETTFEQFLCGYNGNMSRREPLLAFHNPMDNKEFFKNFENLVAEPNKYEITSPYNLGLFLALGSYHRAREGKEDTKALQETRDYVLNLQAAPEKLESELKDYLTWREDVNLSELS